MVQRLPNFTDEDSTKWDKYYIMFILKEYYDFTEFLNFLYIDFFHNTWNKYAAA